MRVTVSSPVWSDLAEIAEYIALDNPDAALRLLDAARKNFQLIGDHPGIGHLRTFSQAGVRSWAISDFPNYLIIYLQQRDEVTIIGVVHGARDIAAIIEERL